VPQANERQVGGSHYQSGFQHWDFVVRCLDNRYLEGQITKYVSRWRRKNGFQDLEKASHFLEKLTEEFKEGRIRPLRHVPGFEPMAEKFCTYSELKGCERSIVVCLATWSGMDQLTTARVAMDELMNQNEPTSGFPPVYLSVEGA